MKMKVSALQISVTGIMAIGWLLKGGVAALAALLGGLAVVVPSLYFAYRFFAVTHARHADRIIKAFYWGELTKILLSAGLVIAIARIWPAMPELPFFSTFVAAYLSIWGAPLIMMRK